MSFTGQKQRGLFYAARHDPAIRKKHGLKLKAVKKMIEHDEGGELPEKKEKKGMIHSLAKANKKTRN